MNVTFDISHLTDGKVKSSLNYYIYKRDMDIFLDSCNELKNYLEDKIYYDISLIFVDEDERKFNISISEDGMLFYLKTELVEIDLTVKPKRKKFISLLELLIEQIKNYQIEEQEKFNLSLAEELDDFDELEDLEELDHKKIIDLTEEDDGYEDDTEDEEEAAVAVKDLRRTLSLSSNSSESVEMSKMRNKEKNKKSSSSSESSDESDSEKSKSSVKSDILDNNIDVLKSVKENKLIDLTKSQIKSDKISKTPNFKRTKGSDDLDDSDSSEELNKSKTQLIKPQKTAKHTQKAKNGKDGQEDKLEKIRRLEKKILDINL